MNTSTRPPSEDPSPPLDPCRPTKTDPARLELRGRPRAVTRLNRRTIAVLATIAVAAILAAILWGLRPPKPHAPEKEEQKRAPERITRAPGLATLPVDYAGIPRTTARAESQVPQLGPPLGEFGQPIDQSPRPARTPSYRTSARGAQPAPRATQNDTNTDGPIFFDLTDRRRRASTVETQASAPSTRGASATSSLANSSSAATTNPEKKADAAIYGSGTVQHPKSPRQIMAGTLIRAALITGINSDLPGQIIASVVENVFDSATGTQLLVPQGSRLLGQYSEEGTYGQRRVFVKWIRLIRPDGSSIVLDDLPGVDAAGYAGLQDQVDEHMKRLLGGAAVSTLLGIGTELATPDRSGRDGTVIIAARDSAHATINDVGQQITRHNLDIRPTRVIRPGFPVNVIINKDLIL